MDSPTLRRLAAAFLTDEPKTRIRLRHWGLIYAIYLAAGAMFGVVVRFGVLEPWALACWFALLSVGQLAIFAAIRSGWSRCLADPSMTIAQILLGIVAVTFGYAVSGDARSATLLPLMLLLVFGAFTVSWRGIAALTALALCVLAATMLAMHALHPGRYADVVDLSNFLVCIVLLPATSAVAMIFGSFRERLRHERKQLEAALGRIQDLATRDELTGLPNRRQAQELLAAEAQRQRRSGKTFAVALIDLDHFKHINDRHGHAGGDEALRRFAREARDELREIDTIARWGGEEFLVLMPDVDGAAATSAMNRLRLRIMALSLAHERGEIRFTFSAGVAAHDGRGGVAETVSRADEACYRAKADGRNRVDLAGADPSPALAA